MLVRQKYQEMIDMEKNRIPNICRQIKKGVKDGDEKWVQSCMGELGFVTYVIHTFEEIKKELDRK